jgi:signal transduction histidine kinase
VSAGRIGALLGENLFDPAELERRRELRNIEREVTIKSGQRRTVLIHVKAVSIRSGTVLYCCRDVTELRLAEEEVRSLRGKIAHVARLALVGQLMASITHEVKQPLTAIVGNAAAAIRALGDGGNHPHAEELREILEDVATEGRLAAEVIDRLRALSRKRPLSLAPVDLNDVVAETMLHGALPRPAGEHGGLQLEENDEHEPRGEIDRRDVRSRPFAQRRIGRQRVRGGFVVLDEVEDEVQEEQRVDDPLDALLPRVRSAGREGGGRTRAGQCHGAAAACFIARRYCSMKA